MSGGTEYELRRQSEAARTLLAGLRDIGMAGDAELIADSIEGETQLLEAIDAAISEIDETAVLIVGLKDREKVFAERRRAMEERTERIRALIEQAMMLSGSETLRRPAATLSLRKTPPGPIIENEADIPSEFFIPQPVPAPKLDKDALAVALADRDIPGARLSNGGHSLTVRRS